MEEIIKRNKAGDIEYPKGLWSLVSPEALDLVMKMTDRDQYERPTAKDCLLHKWFSTSFTGCKPLKHVVASLHKFGTE